MIQHDVGKISSKIRGGRFGKSETEAATWEPGLAEIVLLCVAVVFLLLLKEALNPDPQVWLWACDRHAEPEVCPSFHQAKVETRNSRALSVKSWPLVEPFKSADKKEGNGLGGFKWPQMV